MEKWISAKQAAELLKITERAIRKQVQSNKVTYRYINGFGQGGKHIEILLSSLPVEAQARYAGLEPAPAASDHVLEYSERQRENADLKLAVVIAYQQSDLPVDEFISAYNHENSLHISRSQLFRWQKKYKEGGNAALVDTRGKHNKGTSTIPDEAWDYFYSLYMTTQKRGVPLCYDWTKNKYPDIPSVYAFYRKVSMVPELAIIRYREGENALNDRLPSMDRNKADISSNDIWFSDHHRIDVFTKSSKGMRTCRLWFTAFFDARSNKIVSYICREAPPDAVIIKKCLKAGIEKNGVPKELYFDNGKDYRSNSFRKDFPLSICNMIGIGQIYATPYHGQAKPIERFFRTFEERFGKMFPTYTGKDAKNRPEPMRTADKNIYLIAPSLEDFLECLNNYIEDYNHTPSRGKDMEGKSPDEVYYNNLPVKREITDRRALTILCGNFETRTVNKNGIDFKGRTYENSILFSHFNEKVTVNYDPDNMDVLNIFDNEMRLICTASTKIRTPYRHTTKEDFDEAMKKKKEAKKAVEKYKPVAEVDTMSLIAQKQLTEKLRQEENTKPAAVENVTVGISTGGSESKCSSKGTESQEPDFVDTLLRKYKEEEQKRKIGGF